MFKDINTQCDEMQKYTDTSQASQDGGNMNLSREVAEGNVEIRSYHYTNKLNVISIRKLMNIIPSRRENPDPHIILSWKEKFIHYNVFSGMMQNTTHSEPRNLCLRKISNNIYYLNQASKTEFNL